MLATTVLFVNDADARTKAARLPFGVVAFSADASGRLKR
jgi:hypothetical protein